VAVWPAGELYVDEEEAFKHAISGGQKYKSWWLLKPSALKNIISFARSFGSSTADVTNPKTQLLGGTFIVKDGEVVFTHRETSSFDNGSAREMLAAVLGTSVDQLPKDVPATPRQADAAGETCSK